MGGGEARLIDTQAISGDAKIVNIHPSIAAVGSNIVVNLMSQQSAASNSIATFRILYQDIDGNRYYQQIDKLANNRISVSDPAEILA